MPFNNVFNATSFKRTGPNIFSRSFDGHRVDYLLPKNLHPSTPVLVMHDGMNVFFSKYASTGDTWLIREALADGKIQGDPLVIAVWGEGGTKKYNSRRINEFLCDDIFAARPELWKTLNPALTPQTQEPRGNYFISLVADEILPTILDSLGIEHSPARTALCGCSVAGVSAIYAASKRPDAFGTAFALSAHWEFGQTDLIDELVRRLDPKRQQLIWSDSGTEGLDADSWELNEYFSKQMVTAGFIPRENLETPIFWGTGHHETFWARRFEYPVNWWLSKIGAK